MKISCRSTVRVLSIISFCMLLASCGIFDEKKIVSPEIVGENSNDDHFVSESINQKTLSEGKMLDDINSGILNRIPYGYNLIKFPQKFSSVFIKQTVRQLQGDAYRFSESGAVNKAGPIKETTIKRMVQNCNIEALTESINTAFAVITKKSPLMLMPSNDVWHKDNKTKDRNLLHIDELSIGEAVAVLSVSSDKRYYLVQSRFARGWVPTVNLAFTRYLSWLKVVKPSDFAVVKAPVYRITLDTKDKKIYDYSMGDVILLDSSKSTFEKPVALLPVNENGILSYKNAELTTDSVSVGPLNPTRKNILAQARLYKNLSRSEYSYLEELHSNSRMFSRVYRSVGIYMPLDFDSMKKASPKSIELLGMPYEERLATFAKAKPGDLLFFDNDVALFYGTIPRYSKHVRGVAAYLYVDSVVNEIDYKPVAKQYDRIMVSDLRYLRPSGHTAINEVEFIGQFFSNNENSALLNDSQDVYDPLYIDELESASH
ncbi:SH3 domain-containing protein [Succinivibrio dextrinosolvens]|uniref:SH3 domain-containing protein n=1 Tax=Succinivibrio dextrinosolvens TaxID=83771 RepID=UPI002478B0AC|nr:SH3 domain-containing protein [Succinivibrio dextrinosolvens]